MGADALARGVDDRARGVDERAAGGAVAQRGEAERRAAHVGARAQAEAAEHVRGADHHVARAAARDHRQHEARRPAASPPAAPGRPPCRGRRSTPAPGARRARGTGRRAHRDAAAHRVADDRRALVAERGQQVAQAAGVGAERVVAARLGRAAVAEQVRRDHREVLGQRRQHAAPRVRARGDPVHQQQHRAGPRLVVRDGVAVEPDLLAARGAAHAAGTGFPRGGGAPEPLAPRTAGRRPRSPWRGARAPRR